MGQPSIVEVDYYTLVEKMKLAADSRRLLEKKNKEKWKTYVSENNIREASLLAYGKVKFTTGSPQLVAIEMGSDWDGCYVYSKSDEAALKYVNV